MARGFGAGVLWGVIATGAGLAVLSLTAPPPGGTGTASPDLPAVSATSSAVAEAEAPDQAAADMAAETAAKKAAADRQAADAAAKAAADRAVAEKVAADKALADAAAEKATAEQAAADKAAMDKAAADKAVADIAAVDKAAADKAAVDKAAVDKVAADKVAADKAAADKAAADKAAADKAAADKAAVEEALSAIPPEAGADSPAVIVASDALPKADAPVARDEIPSLAGLDQALTVPEAEPEPAPAEPTPNEPEGPSDALSVPGQPAGQEEAQRLPQIAPVADPEVAADLPPVVAEPSKDASPATSPAATLQDDQPTLPAVKPLEDKLPATVLDKTVPGVKADSLPQVGAAPAPEADTDLPPIRRFARAFAAEGKPLFVILLQDVGAAGMARQDLAKLPFPVSFVVDPLATDASEASATYRAAGQEVLTLANGIPQGAEASDLETTFATLSSILPESVAIMDQDLGGFQNQRPLATLVLPVIKGEGRGLVTYDRGLNAADQIARREGVPAALIFRRLDGEGENKSTIRRYLDRAAFKAAQEGSVVVIGDTRAETVAAILEWTIEGKAATVTLAPVTAVLGR